jgi:hypothetical protein
LSAPLYNKTIRHRARGLRKRGKRKIHHFFVELGFIEPDPNAGLGKDEALWTGNGG